jgi:hypothetical protein
VLRGMAGINPANVAITGGNLSWLFAKANIPVGPAPTGTMGNNGAVTLGTALNTTYANCYLALPAGAIAAGVPAATDFYYVQMSSATVGTVFNNTMSANLDSKGNPTIPASPTAFVTTGPGAFTGVTGAVTVLTLTIPGGTMGVTGNFDFDGVLAYAATATAKVTGFAFGGTSLYSANLAANVGAGRLQSVVTNRNSASVQSAVTFGNASTGGVSTTGGAAYAAVNSGNAVAVTVTLTHATATDTAMLESYRSYITTP